MRKTPLTILTSSSHPLEADILQGFHSSETTTAENKVIFLKQRLSEWGVVGGYCWLGTDTHYCFEIEA